MAYKFRGLVLLALTGFTVFQLMTPSPVSAQSRVEVSKVNEASEVVLPGSAPLIRPPQAPAALMEAVALSRPCKPPSVLVSFPFNTLLPENPLDYKRCMKEAKASRNPKNYRCCVAPRVVPTPSPFPSGACCKAIPGANPGYDCSLPVLNFGHPQGIYFARQRCNSVNQGGSCAWSNNNPKCCVRGTPGCSGFTTPTPTPKPTATPTVTPRPTETPKPTPTVTPRPTETPKPTPTVTPRPTETPKPTPTVTPTPTPKPTATPTPKPTATPTPKPTATPTPRPTATPTPTPSCYPPSVLIPYPFSVLATSTATANEYSRCKMAAGSNSSYQCCVNVPELCSRAGGTMSFGSICGVTSVSVFGPVDGKTCCKNR